jgi:aspartate ammonia-lyase
MYLKPEENNLFRIETDLLGTRRIPARAYYGIHTLRAVENFPISGVQIGRYADLVNALADIKKAAAFTNRDLGLLGKEKADMIARVCDEIRSGQLHDEFVVDAIQGGAGTSTNMNANEVIANRGLELMGQARGDYAKLHPNEDVNMSQSTNDVYPTAIKLALHALTLRLLIAMDELIAAFEAKSVEFATVIKMGRTQLQDAVPMTLGQEFATYQVMLEDDRVLIRQTLRQLHEINLGATAIGTGINSHPFYSESVCDHLSEITGVLLVPARDLVAATQDTGAFVQLSSVLRRSAIRLSKICNDLRLLSSGPRVGLGEINLPPMQAGSSIMPGKVNPVVPEVVNQIAYEVIGNDVTIGHAAENGQLQLNAFEPIIAHSLFKSLNHLRAGCETLAWNCVKGITANSERMRLGVERSIGIVTALNPYIGYSNATAIAKEALESGRAITDLVLDRGLLSKRELDEILRPETLTRPRAVAAEE